MKKSRTVLLGLALLGSLSLGVTPAFAAEPAASPAPAAPAQRNPADENVTYNIKSLRVHKMNCQFARICTNNCVTMKRSEAQSKGATPCKVCGG